MALTLVLGTPQLGRAGRVLEGALPGGDAVRVREGQPAAAFGCGARQECGRGGLCAGVVELIPLVVHHACTQQATPSKVGAWR